MNKEKRLLAKRARLIGAHNELDRICALVQNFPPRYIDQRVNIKGQIAEIEEQLRQIDKSRRRER